MRSTTWRMEVSSVRALGLAAQAQQQQVPGLVGVEGGLGVELELDARRGRGLAAHVVGRGQQVLHDLAAVLGGVADGLAQPSGHRQQR